MTSNNGTEIRVLAATGVCGSGFRQTSLDEAMRRQPHGIGCDCGSTDPGPSPPHHAVSGNCSPILFLTEGMTL